MGKHLMRFIDFFLYKYYTISFAFLREMDTSHFRLFADFLLQCICYGIFF